MFNVEEAPVEIFEWLEKYDFEDLPEKNRIICLNYFTAEEYSDMRTATQALQRNAESAQIAAANKNIVMARYDHQHRIPTARSVAWIWKIAAVLFPIMLIAVTYWFSKGQDQEHTTLVVHDTVYLHKTGEQTTVYDTVFIEKVQETAASESDYKPEPKPAANMTTNETVNVLSVVPFTDQEEVQNTIRYYSVRDDSLFNLFPSVGLSNLQN